MKCLGLPVAQPYLTMGEQTRQMYLKRLRWYAVGYSMGAKSNTRYGVFDYVNSSTTMQAIQLPVTTAAARQECSVCMWPPG
jgi:hypothetical protein